MILCREKARVVITGTRQETVDSALSDIIDRIPDASVTGLALETRDPSASQAVVERACAAFGRIDGFLGCAAVSGSDRAEDMSIEEWQRVIDVNLNGSFYITQAVGKAMIEAGGGGSILLVSSTDGLGGQASRSHYVASKHGLHGLVRNLALEWGHHGIRVNAIAPSVIDTPLLRRNMPPAFLESVMIDRCPLGRMALAEEVAAAGLLLLSDAASYVTGVVLPVDGGLTAGFWTRANGTDYSSLKLLSSGVYHE